MNPQNHKPLTQVMTERMAQRTKARESANRLIQLIIEKLPDDSDQHALILSMVVTDLQWAAARGGEKP